MALLKRKNRLFGLLCVGQILMSLSSQAQADDPARVLDAIQSLIEEYNYVVQKTGEAIANHKNSKARLANRMRSLFHLASIRYRALQNLPLAAPQREALEKAFSECQSKAKYVMWLLDGRLEPPEMIRAKTVEIIQTTGKVRLSMDDSDTILTFWASSAACHDSDLGLSDSERVALLIGALGRGVWIQFPESPAPNSYAFFTADSAPIPLSDQSGKVVVWESPWTNKAKKIGELNPPKIFSWRAVRKMQKPTTMATPVLCGPEVSDEAGS